MAPRSTSGGVSGYSLSLRPGAALQPCRASWPTLTCPPSAGTWRPTSRGTAATELTRLRRYGGRGAGAAGLQTAVKDQQCDDDQAKLEDHLKCDYWAKVTDQERDDGQAEKVDQLERE